MCYYGQNFPNLPHEYGEVNVAAIDPKFQSEFIIHFHECDALSMMIHTQDKDRWKYSDDIHFKRRN